MNTAKSVLCLASAALVSACVSAKTPVGGPGDCGSVEFTDAGELVISGDRHGMNWILRNDGSQYSFLQPQDRWGAFRCPEALSGKIEETFERRKDGGDLVESLTLRNVSGESVDLGGAAVCFPFNDNYPDSKECVTRRCNAHLWPFGSAAWACCLRMGGEAPHLGWMLTEGELDGYAIERRGRRLGSSNYRGVMTFLLKGRVLSPGETYRLEWRVFSHSGWDDFFAKLEAKGSFAVTDMKSFVREGEKAGEKIWRVERGGKWTRIETLAISDFRKFIERRLDFILDRQQLHAPGDIRDGAFLPYDNETDCMYKDWEQDVHRFDCDEGRERIGMGIAIAEAVRDRGYSNPKALPALEKYARFIRTALQDGDFKTRNEVLRDGENRIYNYAWVARFYFDMYDLTGDGKYLDYGYGTAKATFREGGHNFYLIDMPVRQSIATLERCGRREEAASLLADYRKTADRYVENGLVAPKSEVNYEQSILAPAANFLCEMYLVTGEEKYKKGVEALLPAVEAFNGRQPSWHLYDVAIRHWDGYWFGKRRLFGDTFPHYWSCITADLFGNWAEATGDESYRERASEICKANLGLFTEDGRGGAAYMYPDLMDGVRGRFLDPLANDQDWVLVYAARWLEANDWENPAVNSRNRLPARTYSMPLADEKDALTDDLEPATPWKLSLNGEWKFKWAGDPARRPADFWKTGFRLTGSDPSI